MAETDASEHDVRLEREEAAWDRFIASQPGTGFMQSSWWADFQAIRGWGHFGVVFQDGETIVGGAKVMRSEFAPGQCFYYIPEGPVISQEESDITEVFQQIMTFVQTKRTQDELRVSHVRIEPRWEHLPSCVGEFHQSSGWMEPRNTLYIDLTPSESAILAQMKPKGRYNIGVARKHGVSITEDPSPQGIADFLSIYQETMARHALGGNSQGYFHELITRLAAFQCGSVFFAEYQGMRVATALVVYFGPRATYFFGGSRAAHRNVMAPYLMHFEIMKKAKALGCEWYDMYGIAPNNQADHRWAKISSFKRKLGGRDFNFVPTMDYIFDPISYQQYREYRRKRDSERRHAASDPPSET
jgi:peptidoglycan pentaglycine glycine transferase (the first glycine)